MDLKQINEWRTSHGMLAFVPDADKAKRDKRAQAANRAAHAELQRSIKEKRGSRSKAK